MFAVRERLDAVESGVSVGHQFRAAADRERSSSGIVAISHLAHRVAALIEGCRAQEGAAGVEVGADAGGLTAARLTRCREQRHHRLISVLTSIK